LVTLVAERRVLQQDMLLVGCVLRLHEVQMMSSLSKYAMTRNTPMPPSSTLCKITINVQAGHELNALPHL
jgi:hypothetical protein